MTNLKLEILREMLKVRTHSPEIRNVDMILGTEWHEDARTGRST